MGDFKLDLLRYNHHTPTQEFIDTLFSHIFIPVISNPTRLTSYSATLIDNIFTNNLSQNVLNGIVLNNLSDHLPVFAYFSGKTLTRDGENEYSRVYSACFPLKFIKGKLLNNCSFPWINPRLLKSINKKNRL